MKVQGEEIVGGLLCDQGKLEECRFSDEHRRKIENLYGEAESEFYKAWDQALINSGVPPEFADGTKYQRGVFWQKGLPFGANYICEVDHDLRKRIIAGSERYNPLKDISQYAYRLTNKCDLDLNLMQALDSLEASNRAPSNALLVSDSFAWLVNKFPYNIGDTLVLPINHDDLTSRAVFDEKDRTWARNHRQQTRGALTSERYLSFVIAVCDYYNQTASRNHALDGMSIPMHDHYKLVPHGNPLFLQLDTLIDQSATNYNGVFLYAPRNTPFDTLVMTGADKLALAIVAAEKLNFLEREDKIFTVIYHKGHLLITSRREELYGDGNRDGWTGSTVGAHGFERSSEHLRRVKQYVRTKLDPLPGNEVGDQGVPLRGIDSYKMEGLTVREQVVAKYSPIDYKPQNIWGNGDLLESPIVPPVVRELYKETKKRDLQDKRDDPGHGEVVTYLACSLAELLGLDDRQKEQAALAAVLHDCGYSLIDNVQSRFAAITRGSFSSAANERAAAAKEDAKIRVEHQEKAGELVDQLIPNHPDKEIIRAIILDHDTRTHLPQNMAESVMRDADMLARVTWVAAASMIARDPQFKDIERSLNVMAEQLIKTSKTGFYNVESLVVGRIELANAAKRLSANNEQLLPQLFKDEFAEELRML